jgi:arginase
VVLGGDCLVDLAPCAYLNDHYDGELAVLWVDVHADIMTPEQFRLKGNQAIRDWFQSTQAKHLAIHLDLDVLDPNLFRSLLFSNAEQSPNQFDGVAQGKMTMAEIVDVLCDVSKISDVVGLGIAEHLPWDALALKSMLEKLPLIGNES